MQKSLIMTDLADYLQHSFERDNFTVTVPDFIHNVKRPDNYAIDVLRENDLQPLRLFFKRKVANRLKAVIFVTTYGGDHDEKNIENSQTAFKLFRELNFEVQIYLDLSKSEIIEKMDLLQV